MKLNFRPNQKDCELAKSRRSICAKIAPYYSSLLYTVFIHIILVTCSDDHISPQSNNLQQLANTELHRNQTNTLPGRDVTNLHLKPDFRAVKLRWSYQHNDKNQPASFDVRFCELTSWNIEIKCRHREMMVEHEPSKGERTWPTGKHHQRQVADWYAAKAVDNSVISKAAPIETVHQLEPPNGPDYEAQIFDLRALTNYTFQVQVSRFEHEPSPPIDNNNNRNLSNKRNRGQSARRLSQETGSEQHLMVRRIETKPFSAEATKCLSDVSEVLINTGRYFGGRISVEDSTDPRCHLIGNKSSEQSTYLFRIDHEICASKTVDGNRIETMILVHENKDILTHNTARFLVLCNFLQKSFTLRASVSLPKVNALMATSRPAVITSLPRYQASLEPPAAGDLTSSDSSKATSVMLGSMPGIYRARVPHANNSDSGSPTNDPALKRAITTKETSNLLLSGAEDANHQGTSLKPAVNNRQPLDELETNTIERKFVERDSLQLKLAAAGSESKVAAKSEPEATITSRQSKELGLSAVAVSRRDSNGIDGSRARSLMLLAPDQESNKFLLPQPVQVQSKVLFIERTEGGGSGAGSSSSVRTGKLHQPPMQQHHHQPPQEMQNLQQGYNGLGQHSTTTNSVENSSQIDTPESPAARMATTSALAPSIAASPPPIPLVVTTDREPVYSKQLAHKLTSEESDDLQAYPPVIITNNHRVTGDYIPVAQLAANSRAASKMLSSLDNNGNNFTIKYSANRVDEFPVGSQLLPLVELGSGSGQSLMMMVRGRSGRMRSIGDALPSIAHRQEPTMTTPAPVDPNLLNHPKQPAWIVNRMGESLSGDDGSGVDLMAETSNETTNQIMPVTNSSSLAQNITGAILRWSLRTLTNLARKSLESLMIDPTNSTTTTSELNPANETISQPIIELEQGARWEPQAAATTTPELARRATQAARKSHLPTTATITTPTTTTSRRSSSLPQVTGDKIAESQPEIVGEAILSTNSVQQVRPSDEVLADGFITNGRPTVPFEGHLPKSTRQPMTLHHTRPTNYSKSLDLSRSESGVNRHRNTSERNAVTQKPAAKDSNAVAKQPATSTSRTTNGTPENQAHSNESIWNNRDSFYSSWVFYGILMFAALVTAIFLTVCLVSSSPGRSHSRQAFDCGAEARAIRPLGLSCESANTGLVFGSSMSDSTGQLPGLIHDTTYRKYDYNKFENYSSETINNKRGLLADGDEVSASRRSPSDVSHTTTTRSTSANSTLMADENDCKNNEFLYTEHVLINAGSSFGESYA